MKRKCTVMAATLILFVFHTAASAQSIYNGRVVAVGTQAVRAPYSGYVQDIYIQSGESIREGVDVAAMETEKVYASADGEVSGVFAHEGDLAEAVVDRYGAMMYIEPSNRFRLDASTQKGYSMSENKYVHIGEEVFLSCTRDGSHTGKGFVSALDDEDSKKFTVEIVEGEFYMNETVGIFRNPEYTSLSKIGQGTIIRTPPIPINAEGSILRIHVMSGDSVKRGALLFETVNSRLDKLEPVSSVVQSEVAGVVASVDAQPGTKVEKGAAIATLYPANAIVIEMEIFEGDLQSVSVGDEVEIEFNWNVGVTERTDGMISSISYLATEDEASGMARYHAYIRFIPDENVRIGMTAVIYVK